MKGLKRRLVAGFGIIIVLVVVALEGMFLMTVREYYLGGAVESLSTRATTSAQFYNKYLQGYTLKDRAKYLLENIAKDEFALVEIIDWQGKVIQNSYGFSPNTQVDTPDVATALAGETGVWVGKSKGTKEHLVAVSNPLENDGNQIVGVLRYTVSAEPAFELIEKITIVAIAIGVAVILISFVLSLFLANRIIGPIKELTAAVKQMARGNFTDRVQKRYDDEVGSLADSFNRMAEELGKNEQLKNEFISSISHELRTPLTSIKGWGETILSGDLDDKDETLQGLTVISKETDRLIGLVEELLDFSKFQAGTMKMERELIDIGHMLEEVVLQFGYRQSTKERDIELIKPAESYLVDGDPNRLKQVFVNLLDNAYKFTDDHGQIKITVEACNKMVEISVIDDGEGIARADLQRVTEKFYKGDSRQAGSGLGLSICKEIILLHQGNLRIESERGKGTKVFVTLPLIELTPEGNV